MSILDGATIEFENNNPQIASELKDGLVEGDLFDRVLVAEICNYLGINDTNYTDPDIFIKINKIIQITGKDGAMNAIQRITNEVGFKPGVLDDIYSTLRIRGVC